MGKGSRARPFEVPHDEFANSWEKIFGKKDKKPEEKNTEEKPKTDDSEKTK